MARHKKVILSENEIFPSSRLKPLQWWNYTYRSQKKERIIFLRNRKKTLGIQNYFCEHCSFEKVIINQKEHWYTFQLAMAAIRREKDKKR